MSTFINLPTVTADAIVVVPTAADLPDGVEEGSLRYVADEDVFYVYDGATWTEVAGGGGGSGDVVGPASSTDNAVARFDSTTGKLLQNTANFTIADSGEATSASLTASRVLVSGTSKELQSSSVTTTTLGYLDATSSIQTQIDGKQPLDGTLTALAGLTIAADSLTVGTGADAFSQTSFAANTFPAKASTGNLVAKSITDFGLSLVDDANAAAAVTTLGLDNTKIASIGVTLDGGGSAITTGVKGYIEVPYACTINRVTMLADQSGSIVVDIWKDAYANYPPTDADSITASAPPTISAATKSQDSTLTGWTTSVSAGDILGFNVDSASAITRLHLILKVTKT